MSDTLQITIDRTSDYSTLLTSGSLVITFDDYYDQTILEHLFHSEYIEIEIKSSAFHYIVYISSEYIEYFVSKISLCKYRTTECIVVRNAYRIYVYSDSRICVDSQCVSVQRVYPVEIYIRVRTYDGNVPLMTYRFTLEKFETVEFTLDVIVMYMITAVIIIYVIQLISDVFTE